MTSDFEPSVQCIHGWVLLFPPTSPERISGLSAHPDAVVVSPVGIGHLVVAVAFFAAVTDTAWQSHWMGLASP